MPVLNLGVVAHVDAGKTTLTEHLLHATGVTSHLGRVDHGDATTDADAIERARGITIRSAVATFTVPGPDGADVRVNLIDTPGHADFVAEVERALAVLDGAVLVVSAVEGVQAQTRVLVRALERLAIPFLVFVNKIDRAGASPPAVIEQLRAALEGEAVALTDAVDAGSRAAWVRPRTGAAFVDELVDRVSVHDEALLRRFVETGRTPSLGEALDALAEQSRRGTLHPVLLGAALAGRGVDEVLAALPVYLPRTSDDGVGPLHASVFSIERDAGGHRVAYVRVHAGTLASRDHVEVHHREPTGRTTTHPARAVEVATFDRGASTARRPARAGEIARVAGLEVAVGDQLGRWDPARGGRHFAPPGLESVVRPRDPAQRVALFQALRRLAEQDPLIAARLDDLDHEITVDLYGEVQKEVLAARLERDHGVLADFLPTRVVHVERVVGTAEGFDRTALGNASLGLRVEAAAQGGTGVGYRLGPGVERGYLLPSFHTAVQEQLAVELRTGLHGWRLDEGQVVVTHARFCAPTPSAGEYRRLTATAFRQALRAAGTVVCAPVSRFEVDLPVGALTAVLALLADVGATPVPEQQGPDRVRITGTVATGHVHELERRLPDLTSGLGSFWAEPAGYYPVPGPPPVREARTLQWS